MPSIGGRNPRTFELYDAVRYPSKRTSFGKNIFIVYWFLLWRANEDNKVLPPRQRAESIIDTLIRDNYQGPIIIDVEHLDVYNSTQDRTLLITIMSWFKERLPNNEIGNYAISPKRDEVASLLQTDHPSFLSWRNANQQVSVIADQSTTLFPSLYTLTPDPSRWERFAVANIEEARRYGPSKRIIPFLMPVYHESIKFRGSHFIDKDFWRLQLMTCLRMCEGAIVWLDADQGWINFRPHIQWDMNTPWHQATLEFIHEYTT